VTRGQPPGQRLGGLARNAKWEGSIGKKSTLRGMERSARPGRLSRSCQEATLPYVVLHTEGDASDVAFVSRGRESWPSQGGRPSNQASSSAPPPTSTAPTSPHV
jgi:hypothetical protein